MEKQITWVDWIHVATPFLLLLLTALGTLVYSKVEDIDNKLFHHLTNDELHAPRSLVVTKAEYTIYQQMRDAQMKDLKDGIIDIKAMLVEHERNTAKTNKINTKWQEDNEK